MANVAKKTGADPLNPANAGDKPSLLRLGAFTLDLNRHGLYLGSERLHLTSKPFETLAVLVEHRGKTVQKQQLLDAVWKDAFVTEDSLVKAIRDIRRALDDEKANPQFIQTVPGEGYRFIADVTSAQPDEKQQASSAHITEGTSDGVPIVLGAPGGKSRRRIWGLGTAVVLLVGLGAAGIFWRFWNTPQSSTHSFIGAFSAAYTSLSLSPDSSLIAFIADVEGIPQVWIRSLAGGEPIPITSGNSPATHPSWSPSNNEIVFSRGEDSRSIWSVPPLGGQAPTLLIEEGRNPRWSLKGDQLVFEKRDEIWTANADGTHQQRVQGIPEVDLLIVDREPSFSPDGSKIAFFQPQDGPMGDIWIIPTGGGQAKQLTFDSHNGGGLTWTPDGSYIIFSSQRGGSKTLWKIHPSGGNPEPVLNSPGEDTNPEISRDGTRLFYVRTRNEWALTLKDTVSGKSSELRQTITDMFFPAFSPEGDRIAFFATVDKGDIQLFTIRTDGKELAQVTRGQRERNVFPTWSTDSSTLYFYQTRPALSFRGIPSGGGSSFEIASGWRWRTQNGAQVDPTGKIVVYAKVNKGLTIATVFREIQTGSEKVFARTLDSPRWSKDGKSIVGVDTNSSNGFADILVCSVETAACRKVAGAGTSPVWSDDDSRIYFERWKSRDTRELWSVSAQGKSEKWIFERQNDPMGSFYDVSRAGQVAYVHFRQGRKELWVTEYK